MIRHVGHVLTTKMVFCDRKGILVDEEDSCEKHREDWRDRLLDHFLRGHGGIKR